MLNREIKRAMFRNAAIASLNVCAVAPSWCSHIIRKSYDFQLGLQKVLQYRSTALAVNCNCSGPQYGPITPRAKMPHHCHAICTEQLSKTKWCKTSDNKRKLPKNPTSGCKTTKNKRICINAENKPNKKISRLRYVLRLYRYSSLFNKIGKRWSSWIHYA